MDEIRVLMRLQEIDLELIRSMKAVENLPQKEKIQRLRRGIKQANTELSRVRGKRKDLEMDLEDNEQAQLEASIAVDDAQAQAEQSDQSYRAIKDLETQLTSLAKRLEKLSFDHNKLAVALEEAKADEAAKLDLIQRASAEEETQLASYKANLDELKQKMDKLKQERSKLVEEIDSGLLSRYNAAYKRFDGLAVETLSGNKPSVCRVSLQPGQLASLRAGSVAECPYCRRMLVVPN